MREPNSYGLGKHEFLIRRLHSLSGLIPVGAFLIVHLLTNASVLAGARTYQMQVDRIHSLGPALIAVEWVFIFIPILFHGILGVYMIRGGQPNAGQYSYPKNVRYTLQRVTGMIAFVFILAHVWHMHNLGSYLGGGYFDPHHATSSAAAALGAGLWLQILYGIGVLASVFHLANGLWTMGITWGFWTTAAAQKRADRVCIGFGVALAVVGLMGLVGMRQVDEVEALAVESALIEERESIDRRVEERIRDLREQQGVQKVSNTQPSGEPSAPADSAEPSTGAPQNLPAEPSSTPPLGLPSDHAVDLPAEER